MIKIERIMNIEFSKVVRLHTSPQLGGRFACQLPHREVKKDGLIVRKQCL